MEQQGETAVEIQEVPVVETQEVQAEKRGEDQAGVMMEEKEVAWKAM